MGGSNQRKKRTRKRLGEPLISCRRNTKSPCAAACRTIWGCAVTARLCHLIAAGPRALHASRCSSPHRVCTRGVRFQHLGFSFRV